MLFLHPAKKCRLAGDRVPPGMWYDIPVPGSGRKAAPRNETEEQEGTEMMTGERIASARKRLRIDGRECTQEKLAEKLDVTPQAVSSWERDECLPDTKNLVALADTLGVTLDSLLREDGGWTLKPINYDPDRMFTFVKGRAQTFCLPQTLKVLDMVKPAYDSLPRRSRYGFETKYTVHPLTMACHALAMKLRDDDVIAAALAHDMLEDTPIKLADLPVNGRVKEAVRLVSKNEYDHGDPHWEDRYFGEILKNPLACMVKCLDRVNNLAGMADAFTWKKMVKYTAETDRYYPALLDVLKKIPEWNDAWWLLRYQMNTMTEAFKRLL